MVDVLTLRQTAAFGLLKFMERLLVQLKAAGIVGQL